ncbi:ABC transporter substrate-binding protein [Nitrincola iocasae]|uniref:ABC transporter substrate-binding protein n=1 Tax=Nitrincola iocasae TaxID=2614693 RepID=A0A5J6LGZ3_9GAMM|nr:ABC transporter substrate-binding protein [Nitrincola iocasae]QEW07461.1 ABC transporter substrate-binding protein [Nitrincola iocasae]
MPYRRKRLWRVLLLALLLSWALVVKSEPVRSSEPVPEFVPPFPERILSLDLCMDWILAYHVNKARVAGLSPLHKRYPLPLKLDDWPVHDGSLEQIYQLQPDLVLVGEYNALLLRNRLKTLQLPVAVVSLPQSLEQIEDYERTLLQLIGLPANLATPAPNEQPLDLSAPRLLLLGANGIGTGSGTFEDQILRQAGWSNYLTDKGYVSLDLEKLVSDPPDALLWASPDSPSLANRFAEHPALAGRIPEPRWLTTDYWRWQCPGPWTWELIEQLRQAREVWH